jgi:hypothetical protein
VGKKRKEGLVVSQKTMSNAIGALAEQVKGQKELQLAVLSGVKDMATAVVPLLASAVLKRSQELSDEHSQRMQHEAQRRSEEHAEHVERMKKAQGLRTPKDDAVIPPMSAPADHFTRAKS